MGVEQHALGDLGLDSVINVEELLDVISVDDVLGLLRIGGVELYLPVFLERDPGNATNTFLHHFRKSGQKEVCKLRDLCELTKAAFLRTIND